MLNNLGILVKEKAAVIDIYAFSFYLIKIYCACRGNRNEKEKAIWQRNEALCCFVFVVVSFLRHKFITFNIVNILLNYFFIHYLLYISLFKEICNTWY